MNLPTLFRRCAGSIAAVLLSTATGCCSGPTTALVLSEPPQDAALSVNGTAIGKAPNTYTFDFCSNPSYDVTATKDGFFDKKMKVTSDDIHGGSLKLTLIADPAYTATVTCGATAKDGDTIEADPAVPQDVTWNKIVTEVHKVHPALETVDSTSGYLETKTVVTTLPNAADPSHSETLVTSLVVKRISDPGAAGSKQPTSYQFTLLTTISYGSDLDHKMPYPRALSTDADLVTAIKNAIKPR